MERFFQGVEGKGLQVILSIILSLPFVFCFCITCVFRFHVLSQSTFMHSFVLFNMFLFGYLSILFYLFFHIKIKIKIEKSEKYKNSVCFLYIDTSVPWMAIEIKFSKLCIFCSLDELMKLHTIYSSKYLNMKLRTIHCEK